MLKFFRLILSPLVFVYSFIIKVRNWFFDKNIFSAVKVNAKIISVGNITVGGSGKTPTVMMIASYLKSINKKVGVLSRGYGRNSLGYIYVSDGKNINSTVDECGDEVYFMSEELRVPIAVSERRVDGALQFIKDAEVDTIILDDAFQHRWIHRDVDVLIFDQNFLDKPGQIEQHLLPLGSMREPFDSMERADIIIINRKFSEKIKIPDKLKRYFENKNVFNGFYQADGIYDVKSHNFFNMNEFQGQKSLVVCGVALPFSFLNALEKNKIDITNKMIFPDHKNYTLKEVQDIRKKFYDTNCYSVLTTQKDAVKLNKFSKDLDDIDIFYLKIELKLDEQDLFNKLILKQMNKTK
ncbi:MAG: tetraacyldisaccharide 4'-kinase [Ignavibacteriales bacterium]|nr:tetraacyldisaccharide 4'-kinase [Ignavibacteriales bacterium]